MIQDIIERCKEMVLDGEDYVTIKKKLERMPISPDEQKLALRKTDDYLVAYELAKQKKGNALNKMIGGGILFLLGIAVTVGTYAMGSSSFYVWGSAIITGAWFLKEGYKQYKKPIDIELPEYKRIKKGRFKHL